MQIYLDHSATTPTRPEAIAAMTDALTRVWGNPSSLHAWGQAAATAIERARMQVAQLLSAEPESIVFTSGGTESNNWVLSSIARQYDIPQHLIVSSVEHSAVLAPARMLEALGWDVTYLPVDRSGRVHPSDLQRALRPDTVLVSVIYGQSEVGTVQPIRVLADIARSRGVPFHTDAVQVAGRLPLDVQQLCVDFLSLSSHKLYGPKGIGALYVRPGLTLPPLLSGGGQEGGLRSGTQAVPNIAGFGVAAELAVQELEAEAQRLASLRDRLFDRLSDVPMLIPTGHRTHRLPHHVSFCLDRRDDLVTGRSIVRQLNLAGIAISSGSACHSGQLTPSPVLSAMGYNDRMATTGLRLTLGHSTTEADIDWTAMVLKQVLARSRPMVEMK
ncbi:MAG: cysteine desulfurase [Cyanobacteria bacterium SID2]|nr:cysteine desulfurase [Cyanobacteria bacterium SID2]